jgi:hypothetical protein
MKSHQKLMLLMLLLITPAMAQPLKTRIGFSVAGTVSNWTGSDASDLAEGMSDAFSESGMVGSLEKKPIIGYAMGAFIEHRLNKSFILQPEIYYINKGCKLSGSLAYLGYSIDTEILFKLNYFQIPLLLKLAPEKDRFTTIFSVFAGPYIALESASIMKVKVKVEGESESSEEDIEDLEGTEFGGIVGIGIMAPSGVRFNIQYQKAFSKATSDTEIYNTLFSASLGFVF